MIHSEHTSQTSNSFLSSACLIDVLWCVALAIYVLVGVPIVPLHGDEPTQIFMGRDFYYHLQSESVAFTPWEELSGDEATEQQLRLINGTLPKYLFGMVAYARGYAIEDINQQWAWGSGWDWNHANGHVPDDDLLLSTRYASATLLTVAVIAMFGIGWTVAGRSVGYLASGYLALNPAILVNGRRAMMEGSMLAFTLLAVLVALWTIQQRRWWQFVLLGILSGLAVASKHTAVVTVAALFVSMGSAFLWQLWRDEKSSVRWRDFVTLFGAGVLSIAVFFALTPAWWHNPVGTLSTMLELRQDLLAGQTAFFGGYDTPLEQLAGFWEQAFIAQPDIVDNDFDSFETAQAERITAYQTSLWHGVSIGGTWFGGVMLLCAVVIGSFRLMVSRWLIFSSQIDYAHAWIIALWTVAMVVLTLILTPIAWQRYYLPLYPVVGLLGAMGVDFALGLIRIGYKYTPSDKS